ncbi:MAG: pyrroline-5-carboxylate reductase [Bacteroidales bacterium]
MKIAIIGVGNMGGAILKALNQGELINPRDITASDPSAKILEHLKLIAPNIKYTSSNQEAVDGANMVIICVKPWLVEDIISQFKYSINRSKQIFVSIAAGISLDTLAKCLSENGICPPIYRVIPNVAIEVKESMTFIATQNGTIEQTEKVMSVFDEFGKTALITETEMETATALGSCGIAFGFKYIRSVMEAGVEMGFSASASKQIAIQTMRGALDYLEKTQEHPSAAIDKVTTPGGITIKGINELDHQGFVSAVIKAYKACK